MEIKLIMTDIKDFNEENYINKPIIFQNCPIGVIQEVKIQNNQIEIQGVIWDKLIQVNTSYKIKNDTYIFDCLNLDIKDYSKCNKNEDKAFQERMELENAEFRIKNGF